MHRATLALVNLRGRPSFRVRPSEPSRLALGVQPRDVLLGEPEASRHFQARVPGVAKRDDHEVPKRDVVLLITADHVRTAENNGLAIARDPRKSLRARAFPVAG